MAGRPAHEIARLLAEGVRLHRLGDLRKADNCYRRVLRLDPRQADALHLAGLIAHQTGEQERALTLIERALAVNVRQAPFHNSHGVVLLALDRLADAEAAFLRALDCDPLYAEALNNLGNALQRQERNEQAVAAYDRALELQPAYAEAWCNRGRTLHLAGRAAEAVTSLRRAIELRAEWPKAIRYLGDAATAAGDLTEAEACYRQALALDPADAEAHTALASLLERGNRLDEALAAADAALAADPHILRAAVVAAKVLRRVGGLEEALGRLTGSDFSAARVDERATAAFERGQILDRLGAYAPAYEAFVEGNQLLAQMPAACRIDRTIFPSMIARLRACFTAEWVSGWASLPPPNASPIFLLGFPRSGTTLLDQILDAHPALTTMEEKDALDQVRRAVEQLPGGYPEALAGLDEAAIVDMRRLYHEEVRRHVGDLEGLALVDKMPLNTIDAGLIFRMFPNARILLALRHPCDVVLSGFMQAMQPNAAMVLFDSIDSTARFYTEVMELWRQYRRVLPLSVLTIRYEDLVADLAAETRRILDFLDLPWDDAVLGYAEHARTRTISTPSYHQVVQPIYRRSVDRWRNYAFALDEALPLLRPFIEEFGYAPGEPPAD
ncbi:MAG: sulfotransferase [Rhodospirillales bacterium]|nr:sulfotransferase [Rhodospirillales bacterium]